ncbi:TMEM175 family protein [Robiginitalea sp. M366]|uniref:TMEM175 family protein n=1 Tax=Robiginitalea aestuariiviva TaxID=3036903 RepID=UPI00240E04F2|nr:TMEM175 family protein [Robiginitalea aestuariiviva]MDG1573450.1 TMEM175 family protein [Robiginitalea aestuariiviva]
MTKPHHSGRLQAFSDGVFAFAATLMVVSLDLNRGVAELMAQGSNLVAFGVSFFVLVALWVVHYNYFRRSGYVDYWIMAYNALLLFVILYYVFPLKSLVHSWMGTQQMTLEGLSSLFQLYSLGFALIFLCYALMYRRAFKKERNAATAVDLLFYTRHFALYVGVGLLSMLLSALKVGVGVGLPGFIYVLLGPLCYAHSKWFDQKFRPSDL